MNNQYTLTFIAILSFLNITKAQNFSSIIDKNSSFDMGLEYRPRTEYRRGYRSIPSNDDDGAFVTSHRARINMDFNLNNKFKFHTTLQDIRIWGDTDTRDANGKAQFYEFYVEPKISEEISVRVGRQRIKYDDQRLFAENNWRQAGGQHDAVRFIYNNNKNLDSDLILAYNQDNAQEFGTNYEIDWDFYRGMITHFLHYNINQSFSLTTINVADEYTDPTTNDKKGYWKHTNGGRITYKKDAIDFTFSGYYQWGKIENGKQHNAYYLQPEIAVNVSNNYALKLGAQVLSGDGNSTDEKSTAFLAQYGAFHRHNGGMDFTQRTVRTNEHEGIFNPYLFQDIQLNNKLKLNWQSHLLGATTTLEVDTKKESRIYGWENDIRLFYQPNSYTKIEFAYLFLTPNESMKVLPTGENGNTDQLAQFAYVSVNWTPKLLSIHNK
ncbi:alginate export family protein [Wenyingzhuangia sp. IMCC45574]